MTLGHYIAYGILFTLAGGCFAAFLSTKWYIGWWIGGLILNLWLLGGAIHVVLHFAHKYW